MVNAYCDIVMKGGVTSGVVYPPAIVEIARTFSFKNVGGTSAGAIAAALTAAAQVGRLRKSECGFELLARLPEELAADNLLLRLFHPNKRTAGLFNAVAAIAGKKTWPEKLASVLWERRLWAALGALPAAVLFLRSEREWYDAILPLIYGFGGALIGSAGALAYDAVVGITANNYGLISGITDDGSNAPALTSWLEEQLRIAAGITDPTTPLTFGMLWDHTTTGRYGHKARPANPDVNLEMVTTCVTLGRPFKFPFDTGRFYFNKKDMRRYFPDNVVAWMEKCARTATKPGEQQRMEARAEEDLIPLPPIGDLPVIVATRMSLSFPVLFSAVPFYMADFLDKKNWSTPGQPVIPELEPVWFSDGGISSNFPISLFDAPLPRWPTFAINLDVLPKGQKSSSDQKQNVLMPKSNRGGILRPFNRFASVFGFLAAIADTMQNWTDTTQAVLPGYRDRIVTVLLDEHEGGLNLSMDSDTLEALRERGAEAGTRIASRFADAAGKEPADESMNWQSHRWLRLRSLFGALQTYLKEYHEEYGPRSESWKKLVDERHTHSYPVSDPTAKEMAALLDEMEKLALRFEKTAGLQSRLPKPPPDFALRPDLGSST